MNRRGICAVWGVTVAAFSLLTVAITWPLATSLGTSVPGDYGDPLFISWAMAWVAERLSVALTAPSSLRTFWDAPIFMPETGALTFSEHFVPQTLLVLPVYWLSRNPILGYNAAFLMSFVLTGASTALLTRALTGSLAAGLFAGIVATFNEYRLIWEVARLQTLSIYWFPFTLLGVHHYLLRGKRWALAGAATAWIALNLSSVYYLAYCAPFIAAFTLVELVRLGRWRDRHAWRDLLVMVGIVYVLSSPFLWPYVQMQQRFQFKRTLQEVVTHSVTIDAVRIGLPRLVVPVCLALLAAFGAVGRRPGSPHRDASEPRSLDPILTFALFAMVIASMWLSFGPVVQSGGQTAGPALYPALAWLPGYSGLRVPARFASLFLIFLGVLAGGGIVRLARRAPRLTPVIALVAASAFLWQGRALRVAVNQVLPSAGLAAPPAYLTPAALLPPIYQRVAQLRQDAVLAELPFGDPWYDVRYMFFSAVHRRALVNGYSGVFPPSYRARQSVLDRPFNHSDRAWLALGPSTHVIVHHAAWPDDTGRRIGAWLVEKGATLQADIDGASLYQLRKTHR